MNLAKRPLYSLCIMVVSANFLVAAPKLYLYLLPFDNNNNEQVIAWLGTGFTDMLTKEMTPLDGLFLRNRDDLEILLDSLDWYNNLRLLQSRCRQLVKISLTPIVSYEINPIS